MKEGKLYTFFVTAENSDGKKSKAVAGPGSSIPEPGSHHKMEVLRKIRHFQVRGSRKTKPESGVM